MTLHKNSSSPLPEAVCALLTNSEGQILVVSRKNDPSAFGLPGGKVDPGETGFEAIVREVREETGLEMANIRPVFMRLCEAGKDGKSFATTTFVGTWSGEIHTTEAGLVKWADKEVLLGGPFATYNRALFKAIDTWLSDIDLIECKSKDK